jgi:YVTN family beta-propeller protein
MRNFIFLVTCHFAFVTVLSAQWLEETIPVGSNPWTLVYNSTNNKIYCANLFSNNVTVIDKYNSVITTIQVGVEPNALVYNSLNNKVYCANENSDNVTVIDGASNALIATIPVGIYPLALVCNSINKKVYCANDVSNTVTVIDGATNSVITTITVGASPRAFAWNPIQNRTYVANYWSNTVSVICDSIISGIEETTNPNAISLMPEIYPNPAKGVIRVRIPLAVKEIKIFDVSGKLVREIASASSRNDRTIEIPLKGINPGLYFLQFGNEVKKFLVVR